MGFATSWLDKRALFPELINEAPAEQTGIIVVVPAYNEPGISVLLDSLAFCDEPGCNVEVIIIVNAPASACDESRQNNSICIRNIESWKKNNQSFFRLYYFNAGLPSVKGWGVGLARKTGMDEALHRFSSIDRPEGIIASLDADCTVGKNYFTALCDELLKKKNMNACSIYFEHPLTGTDFPSDIYKNIIIYELHLRYYLQGLRYSGFPYAFHTVGSSVAVKASKYALCGGMNRRQAGEDFYFIQKLVTLGGYFALNSTTVYPSPRESSRVPFGTGPVMKKLMGKTGEVLLTYNFEAFNELRFLFDSAAKLYIYSSTELKAFFKTFPPGLKSFITEQEWLSRINEIKSNTSGSETFVKRFFGWFNMFRIVKFMNYVHEGLFDKQPVINSAIMLLEKSGKNIGSEDPYDLLAFFRAMEKKG